MSKADFLSCFGQQWSVPVFLKGSGMLSNVLFLVLGFVVSVFGGVLSLTGGAIMIPALVMLFGFSQHEAQGTTVTMMVPPISILAA